MITLIQVLVVVQYGKPVYLVMKVISQSKSENLRPLWLSYEPAQHGTVGHSTTFVICVICQVT